MHPYQDEMPLEDQPQSLRQGESPVHGIVVHRRQRYDGTQPATARCAADTPRSCERSRCDRAVSLNPMPVVRAAAITFTVHRNASIIDAPARVRLIRGMQEPSLRGMPMPDQGSCDHFVYILLATNSRWPSDGQ